MSDQHVCVPIARLWVSLLLVLASAVCTAEPNDRARSYVAIDAAGVDALDRWKPVGRMRLRLTTWHADKEDFALEGRVAVSKSEQAVHGLTRTGLGLPLPETIRLHLWCDVPYLWLVVGDREGHRMSSILPIPGLRAREWSLVSVPLSEMVPMGVGAPRAQDLDSIAILTRESAGEYDDEDTVRLCLSLVEAGYASGLAPRAPDLSETEAKDASARLTARLATIDTLLARARAAGMEARYETASRTVLARFLGGIVSTRLDLGSERTRLVIAWLEGCADRTEKRLRDMLADPRREVRVPHVELANLRARDGTFFAGDRPVILAGVCQGFGPGDFDQLAASGFSAVSIERGPSTMLPAEGVRKPEEVRDILEVMDAAHAHNMVCNLLLSPHYFPDWARAKWPSTDVTGWRQKTNLFMPWTITDPHFRGVIADHLATLIPLVRSHPALLSYDLINEAWYRLIPDFPASGFDDFRREHRDEDYWRNLSAYGTQTVTDFIRWYAAELRKYDAVHPIHVKVLDTPEVQSCDREAIGDVLSANGMDVWSCYPDRSGRLAADFSWPLLRHDFHRSLQPDHPILDDECHICGGQYPTPPSYFRAALWDLALHGRSLSACWISDYWHPACVEALGHAALDFVRLGPEIHAFQKQRGKLVLYYGGTATKEAYLACLFQDVDVALTTARRIRAGRLADYRVLVIAYGTRLPAGVAAAVEAWRTRGGVVVRCGCALEARELWPAVAAALRRARVSPPIRAAERGVECRSVKLGARKLLYVLNHRKTPVSLALRTHWDLEHARDLGTTESLDARSLTLAPLELRLIEAR